MTIKNVIYLLLTSTILGCFQPSIETIAINQEKDLIPEGIAIYKDNIFLSSIHKNKIVCYNLTTKTLTNFINSDAYGFKTGFGLYVKDTLLFALTNHLNPDTLTSLLLVFNINTQKLLKSYALKDGKKHYLNDMAIDDENRVFITDSKSDKVFTVQYPNDTLAEYLSDARLMNPNGIALSGNKKRLFVASTTNGVQIIELKNKKIISEKSIETTGIDGMKYHQGRLFAIRNSDENYANHGLYCIELSENEDKIQGVKSVLVGHSLLNVPTTFDISNNHILMLANSQMDNLNQDNNQIINQGSLTETIILKYKIEK